MYLEILYIFNRYTYTGFRIKYAIKTDMPWNLTKTTQSNLTLEAENNLRWFEMALKPIN